MQRALRCVLRAGQGSTPIFSENEILASKAALAQPEALTAALNYLQGFGSIPVAQRPGGERDGHAADARRLGRTRQPDLDLRLLRGLERWVSCLRIERIPDAGHCVHLEAQTQVNDMMIRFLKDGNRCIRDRLAWVE